MENMEEVMGHTIPNQIHTKVIIKGQNRMLIPRDKCRKVNLGTVIFFPRLKYFLETKCLILNFGFVTHIK